VAEGYHQKGTELVENARWARFGHCVRITGNPSLATFGEELPTTDFLPPLDGEEAARRAH
jgi:hypothetical protein